MGSTSAAEVMRAVEQARASRGLSKAELARRSRVRPETVRHLLTDARANPTLLTVLDMLRPLGLGLDVVALSDPPAEPTNDVLKGWLAHYGAALYGPETGPVPPPETVLAAGLKLARESASVARALPLAFWKTRERLDFDRLVKEGERLGQARTLGFFLDLTSQLSGDPTFADAVVKLRLGPSTPGSATRGSATREPSTSGSSTLRPPSRPTQFFQPTTLRERKMAELRTPDVARKWGFRMNMGMDSFESMFEKGVE
jgi:transcriptional regulator with XRE-family HTH domain